MRLPKRESKRATQRPIMAWCEVADLEKLAKQNVNLSELIRECIANAAKQVSKKK